MQRRRTDEAIPEIDFRAVQAQNDPDLELAAQLQQAEYDSERSRREVSAEDRAARRREQERIVAPNAYLRQEQPVEPVKKEKKKDCVVQ